MRVNDLFALKFTVFTAWGRIPICAKIHSVCRIHSVHSICSMGVDCLFALKIHSIHRVGIYDLFALKFTAFHPKFTAFRVFRAWR